MDGSGRGEDAQVLSFLYGLEESLKLTEEEGLQTLGIPVECGAAVKAAERVIMEG